MTVASNGKKADLYLKFIGILLIANMAILSFVFVRAMERNDRDHEDIIRMVQSLALGFRDFAEHAPPNHIHLDDGTCARVVTEQ